MFEAKSSTVRTDFVLGIAVEILLCSETQQKIVTDSPTASAGTP